MFNFLFWLFLAGIIVACLQDLKRREVDDWLNLFLIITSISFIFFRAYFEKNPSLISQLFFALVVLYILMNLFYYSHIFAGGDAKLLFAMTAFFIGASFTITLINIGLFVLFLMFAGAIYGLCYSASLYFGNFSKVNSNINFQDFPVKLSFSAGAVFLILSFYNISFLAFSVFLLLFPLVYIFARSLEEVSMVKTISGKKLCEGDWLVRDVKVGKKTIKADWGGLSLEDIKLMKNLRKVKIKEGLPFVPAFLIAFISYSFLKDILLDMILRFF
jgi:Flp pilus assembly protein protease CpaA